jgi:peptidoglycan/xylan/chitin deacetylase (PgdA/CDA1 family)
MRSVVRVCAFLSGAAVSCIVLAASPALAQAPHACAAEGGIGVSRTVEIDTRGGPWFGEPHGDPGFLSPGEIVLTFDDGPMPGSTRQILWALAAECTKATFFVVGRMARAYPELVREMAVQGHTIGTHTWSHANLQQVPPEDVRAEIEAAFASTQKAAERPIAPFFRYPYLASTRASVDYLKSRNIAQFSVDVDSLDWRRHDAQSVVRTVMAKLEARGKGIVLLHDIHPSTAAAVPELLLRLKEKGYRIVHVRPKTPMDTIVVASLPKRRNPVQQKGEAEAKSQGSGWLFKWPWQQ